MRSMQFELIPRRTSRLSRVNTVLLDMLQLSVLSSLFVLCDARVVIECDACSLFQRIDS